MTDSAKFVIALLVCVFGLVGLLALLVAWATSDLWRFRLIPKDKRNADPEDPRSGPLTRPWEHEHMCPYCDNCLTHDEYTVSRCHHCMTDIRERIPFGSVRQIHMDGAWLWQLSVSGKKIIRPNRYRVIEPTKPPEPIPELEAEYCDKCTCDRVTGLGVCLRCRAGWHKYGFPIHYIQKGA